MECKTVTVDAVGRSEAVPDLATVEAFTIGEASPPVMLEPLRRIEQPLCGSR